MVRSERAAVLVEGYVLGYETHDAGVHAAQESKLSPWNRVRFLKLTSAMSEHGRSPLVGRPYQFGVGELFAG